MSDWRDAVAAALAEKCREVGVQREDRTRIRKMLYTLAEMERASGEDTVGFRKAVDAYKERGISALLNMTLKYWPIVEEATTATQIEPVPAPPKRVVKIREREPSAAVYQVMLAEAYDKDSVLAHLREHLLAKLQVEVQEITQHSTFPRYDLLCSQSASLSRVFEELKEVSWVVDVVSKPASMFGNFIYEE